MFRGLVYLSVCITLVFGAPTPWNYQPPDGYSLVWSDEFDGTSIDSTKWSHLTTCRPPNNEQQCYTTDPTNSFVANGMLNIVARQRTPIPSTANGMKYTSARIKTVQNFKYGTYVARIKGPFGKGIWPAFWMSGTATGDKVWPWTGEIDIMEYYGGSNPGADDTNAISIHFAKGNVPTGTDVQASHGTYSQRMALQNGARYADAFHIFEAIWTPLSITGRIDGIDVMYVDTTNTDQFNEFNKEAIFFNIILNVAVGGNMGGGDVPDDDPNYSQTMLVDWVRVYQQSTQAINAMTSIPWVFPSLTPTPTGTVKFIDSEIPTSITPRGTFGVKVSYISLSHPTMLILELITPDGATKFGIGTKMVSSGTGTDTIIVPIRALINTAVQLRVYGIAAQNYFNGLGWRSAMSPIESRSVTVGTTISYQPGVTPIRTPNPEGVISSQNAITINTPPLSLMSKQTFIISITYTTDVISQIVVDLLNSVTYTKPSSGTITVHPGTATISIPMTWLSNEVGNNFYYNIFLVKKSVYDVNPSTAWKSPYIGPITVNGVKISSIPTLSLLSPLPSPLTVVTTTLQVKVENSGTNLQLKYNQQGMPSYLYPIPSSSPAIVSFPITLNLTANNHWWLEVVNTQGQVMTTLDTRMTLIPTITIQPQPATQPNHVTANDIAAIDDSTTSIIATSSCDTNTNMGMLIGGIVGGFVIGAVVGTFITYYITKQQHIRVGNKDMIGSSSHVTTTPWTSNPVVEMTTSRN